MDVQQDKEEKLCSKHGTESCDLSLILLVLTVNMSGVTVGATDAVITSTVGPDHTFVDGDATDGAALHKSNMLSLFEQRA